MGALQAMNQELELVVAVGAPGHACALGKVGS